MANEQAGQYLSIADLAGTSTDDVAVLRSRLPTAGTFLVVGEEVGITKSEPKEEGQEPLFAISIKAQIMEATPNDKEIDPEGLEGRSLSDRRVLWPNDFVRELGLVKGLYQKIGLPTNGAPGGAEDEDGNPIEGWLDGIVGWPFKMRIRHSVTKNGEERAYIDYMKADDSVFEAMGLLDSDESESDSADA